MLTGFKEISGEASIAVIRGEPRMGYELTFKAELEGVQDTYLQGAKCELEINELCDDADEPESCDISMTTLLDTS